MLDAKSSGSARTNPNYQTLLSLKPRQVLLAERNTRVTTMKQCSTKTVTLNPDQKALLLQSVIGYLERNGFSKALKRLLSEAQIETDNWKTCSLNLEDVYGNYLETCARAETNLGTYKDEELLTDGTNKKSGDGHSSDIEQTVGNKKKKKSNKGENNVEQVPLDSLQAVTEVKFGSESKVNGKYEKKKHKPRRSESLLVAIEDKSEDDNNFDSRAEGKSKDKKKKKKRSMDSPIENVKQHNTALENTHDVPLEEKKVESKEKKRKKESSVSDALSSDVPNKEDPLTSESKKESFQTLEDAVDKEKKSSKKRKRLASEKDEVHPADKLESEESKRRKTETLEETKTCEQITEVNANAGDHKHAGIESKRENGSVTQYELQNASIKPSEANRNFEKDEVNSAAQKTRRKQHESSPEPKTVNAFQRVKIDEVKFADERLQDNSYWAKDGADVGYGAKAQEILGQVRGRDFRHEKTKKKRGSYRGGQIDLHAHSVKFNYSDED